ncbi:MAG TPA: TonB family protein [Terriglobales bacterium]|nr:TonB family protein [Terriglobales bacterium]
MPANSFGGEDAMFSDLVESHATPARRWTAMASFTLQAALVAAALAYPLFHIESLPPIVRTLLPPIETFAAPGQPQRNFGHAGGLAIHPIIVSTHAMLAPRPITETGDTDLPQAPTIDGTLGDKNQEGLHSLMSEFSNPLPSAPVKPRALRQSVIMEGNLIHKVEPQYPPIAKQLHVEGMVIVKAFISRDGVITRAVAETGPPLLVRAALDAVRQWRYRPYYLNHEPIEVETEITVNFVLQH